MGNGPTQPAKYVPRAIETMHNRQDEVAYWMNRYQDEVAGRTLDNQRHLEDKLMLNQEIDRLHKK